MKAKILTKLALSIICCGVSISQAAEPPVVEELPSVCCDGPIVTYRKVYLNESLPELGARLYDKVDYELKVRQLTADIRIAEAELNVQRERARVYDKYFGYTDALFVTRQEAQLDIVRTEQQLKLLHQARLLALRYRNDQVRYRELLIARGAGLVQVAE